MYFYHSALPSTFLLVIAALKHPLNFILTLIHSSFLPITFTHSHSLQQVTNRCNLPTQPPVSPTSTGETLPHVLYIAIVLFRCATSHPLPGSVAYLPAKFHNAHTHLNSHIHSHKWCTQKSATCNITHSTNNVRLHFPRRQINNSSVSQCHRFHSMNETFVEPDHT